MVPALRGGQVTYCHTQLPACLPACLTWLHGYWPVADTQACCPTPPPYRGFLGRIRVHSVPRLPHHILAVGENLKSRRESALKTETMNPSRDILIYYTPSLSRRLPSRDLQVSLCTIKACDQSWRSCKKMYFTAQRKSKINK